jgi:hypothetical protein
MKKQLFIFLVLVTVYQVSHSQNVGIGTNNPNRARLVLNGSVGNTTAIFGGETTGISLQSNFPTIGFNEYYNNGHRYIAAGHSAHMFFDPALGYMAFDIFPPGVANGTAASSKRLLVLTNTGDMIVGSGLSRVGINMQPTLGSVHNATLQIRQTVEGDNMGISLSDINDNITWKISSLNSMDGMLTLGLNGSTLGWFANDGGYVSFSDRRLKNNIQTLPSILDKVLRLQPVQYQMKKNNQSGRISMGFIAQDVKDLFPGLVHVLPDSVSNKNGGDDLYAVNYTGFGVLAIKAIQEQQQLIEMLQARIDLLERKINPGVTGKN